MGKLSRQKDILNLFYDYPKKQWHFSAIKKEVPIADNKISRWLKLLCSEAIIIKHKPTGSMPYYVSNYENPEYQNRKRIYALENLHSSGLLNHLSVLPNSTMVILFGSFSRWDWHKESDIDLFILGNDEAFEQAKYERILSRPIQVMTCKNIQALRKLDKGLLRNIIIGDLLKGNLDFIEVTAHA